MIEKWMIQYSAKQYYYELNISCPNTAHGQMLSEQIPQLVGLLRTMRDYSSAVISVKCSPDQSNENLYQIAEQVSKIGRCIINLGNTRRVPIYDLDVDPDALTRPVAGLSGPLLLDRTIEMVKIVAPIGVPIIATGGISTIDDIRKLSDAGASLFAMATAVVKDMYVIPRLNKDIRGLSADRWLIQYLLALLNNNFVVNDFLEVLVHFVLALPQVFGIHCIASNLT